MTVSEQHCGISQHTMDQPSIFQLAQDHFYFQAFRKVPASDPNYKSTGLPTTRAHASAKRPSINHTLCDSRSASPPPPTCLHLAAVSRTSIPVCFVMIGSFDFRKIKNLRKQLYSLLCAFKISIPQGLS